MNRGVVVILLTSAALLSACVAGPEFRTWKAEAPHPEPEAGEIVHRGLLLHSGQLIVGDAGAADTLLLSMLSENFSPFVHAGVLAIEHGRPYVYDSYVTVSRFVQGPPKRGPEGGIRRATLDEYLAGQRIVAIYDPPPGVDSSAVARFARARYDDNTPFDVYFDWEDHSRLYCTEFAALALQAGGARLPVLDRIRANRSLGVVLDWLKIDARDIVTTAGLIEGGRRAALISRDYSVEQIDAYFAAKLELHARFTAEQKLGNVWRWTWRGLELQPAVAAFLSASVATPSKPTTQLAAVHLGELR